jgi:RNA polymerase sigma factor (sigma-70 family)
MDSIYAIGRAAHPLVHLDGAPFLERLRAVLSDSADADGIAAADFYLATACELGCPGAWERLEELYADPVRSMALRWGASAADADEIASALPGELLQPTSNGMHRTSLGSFDGAGSLMSWLARVVDRRLVDRARKRRPTALPDFDRHTSSGTAPFEQLIQTETGQRVSAAFEKSLVDLSPRDLQLLVLKFRDGVSQADIAHQLQVTPARVSYLVKRTLDRLRVTVLEEIPDETSGHWLSRDGLACVLNDAIHRVLGA